LRDSGSPDALARAEEKFSIAATEDPCDPIARHQLAMCLDRRGKFRDVIRVLQPHALDNADALLTKTLELLLNAYDKTNEILQAAELRRRIGERESG
jgi:hypothetical protein